MTTQSKQRKLLLVASSGGHLAELLRLAPLLAAGDDSLWVTFRTPQTETLLAGRRVLFVPYIKPRALGSVLRAMVILLWRLKRERFDTAVSTGSGIALACFPIAWLRRLPTVYIESLGRVHGPSTTGRLLGRAGRTTMYTQSPSWATKKWAVHPSVLATYCAVERQSKPGPPKIFVTLGTIEGFPFDALVNAVLETGLADEHTVWQLGCTQFEGLPGTVHQLMSTDAYVACVRAADVVISHAGVGSLLVLLEEGVYPLLVARRGHRGEHVDDHQVQLRGMVNDLGVGRVIDAEELTADLVLSHITRRVIDLKVYETNVQAVA